MKNSIELRQERAELIGKADSMLNLAKDETRDFTNDEQVSYDGMMENIDKLAKNIQAVERQEKLNAEIASNPVSFETQNVSDSKEVRDYSFVDAARASFSGNMTGLVKEMDQEARMKDPGTLYKGVAIPYSVLEARTATAANSKSVEAVSFVDQLQNASVMVKAGANMYTGLSADRKFPIVQNVATSWAGETGSTVTAAGDLAAATLSPKKAISIVDMSAEALAQNSGLEGALRRNLAESIMNKWEAAVLYEGADVNDAPTSLFHDAADTSTAAATLALLAQLEADVVANINSPNPRMAYIFNAAGWSTIAGLAGATFTGGYLNLQDKRINNTPYFVTANLGANGTVAKDKILCGDFSKVHMGIFGGLDLLFDPYTQADHGIGRLVATGLVDSVYPQAATCFTSLVEA